jgi:short-subunit dehydrogenase
VDHQGRVVVVTGASSGIGRDVAVAFARRRARVVAVARREERLRGVVADCASDSPDSFFLAGDLGERAFAEGVVAETLRRCGRLDVLVNNAALPKHKPIYETSAEEVEQVLRVNLLACVWTTLAAIPAMLRQRNGVIVNVSSFAGRVPPPREAVYAASKAALDAFTQGLWSDLAGSGIHAGLVVPGAIDTEIWDKREVPSGYRGRRHPPSLVTDAVLEVVERRRYEIVVPRRSPGLLLAGWLRALWPGALRRGVAHMDPMPPETLRRARERAREGER